MVIGVGVDMVEVARIQRALEDPKIGQRFRDRVYTGSEIQYCEKRLRKYESYAGRFAAKEAVMKALGHGWGSRMGWLDIEIVSRPGGKPEVCLHNKASTLASELGVRHLSVSITHTQHYAMAYLIAEGE
ncbi:MAG: holo-ACP synthase [Candidatus Binatia bacterium]